MSGQNRAHPAGFTLIELLVALTLLGFLSVLMFGGTRLMARAWSKTEVVATDTTDLWAVQDVLRRAIAEAYAAFASQRPTDVTLAFAGEWNSLALVAPLPEAIAGGMPARVRFSLGQERGDRKLVMDWRFDLPDGVMERDNRVVLLDHLRVLRFDYYGEPAPGQQPVWLASWAGRSQFPQLVRVHIERDTSRLPEWPDLVAEPRATMNGACPYDPLAASCRRTR